MENKKIRRAAILKDAEAFDQYLRRYTQHRLTTVIDQLIVGCMVPRHTISNWRRGLARIPELHKCKIEEILGEKIFESPTNC